MRFEASKAALLSEWTKHMGSYSYSWSSQIFPAVIQSMWGEQAWVQEKTPNLHTLLPAALSLLCQAPLQLQRRCLSPSKLSCLQEEGREMENMVPLLPPSGEKDAYPHAFSCAHSRWGASSVCGTFQLCRTVRHTGAMPTTARHVTHRQTGKSWRLYKNVSEENLLLDRFTWN